MYVLMVKIRPMTKDKRLEIRVSDAEKREWTKKAGKKGLSEWIREILNKIVGYSK